MPRKKKHMKGRGIKEFLGKINDFLKKTKIISTVANAIPHPFAKGVGTVAGLAGYGKKRRKRRVGRPRKK